MYAINLPHTITVEPYIGESSYGPQYGSPVTHNARVELGVVGSIGPMIQGTDATARIFIGPDSQIPTNSRIVWIGPFDTQYEFTVSEYSPQMDFDGKHNHSELLVK